MCVIVFGRGYFVVRYVGCWDDMVFYVSGGIRMGRMVRVMIEDGGERLVVCKWWGCWRVGDVVGCFGVWFVVGVVVWMWVRRCLCIGNISFVVVVYVVLCGNVMERRVGVGEGENKSRGMG